MLVRFWGTRGQLAVSNTSTIRYGGNTSCVQVRTSSDTLLILDAGTGIRELGRYLDRQSGPITGHILISHSHWNHVTGFPFFSPLFRVGDRFLIYGARDLDRSLRDVLAGVMHYTYHPVPLGDVRADIDFLELDEGEFRIADTLVRA